VWAARTGRESCHWSIWAGIVSPVGTDPAQIGDAIVMTAMAARFKSSSAGLMIEQANHVANWRMR
jgi:hypothetical protein